MFKGFNPYAQFNYFSDFEEIKQSNMLNELLSVKTYYFNEFMYTHLELNKVNIPWLHTERKYDF